ncbi:hypothetical protein L6164_006981 [Bauhinia variegata]|uniref:Uncharacterized protein n=1 Tax=Bauhinia variegata TaxID=167791 RepID=A0ACB9Q1K2_BAUVA|nr:hypothetical protein L6164_006981 [Bauhinia variegata]
MLLAVEGGGFFSSSASGYSKGLALLLLGQRSEDKPMRVSPWSHYQLVDQESDPELQLASTKNRLSRGCASFVCFGRASAGPDTPSPLKVGPAQQHDVLPGPLVSNKGKDPSANVDDENDAGKISLKSSLKKRPNNAQVPVGAGNRESSLEKPPNNTQVPVEAGNNENEVLDGNGSDPRAQTERRKVQWTDTCGSELAEIREFEPSETDGSDDEFDNGNDRTCSCAIM